MYVNRYDFMRRKNRLMSASCLVIGLLIVLQLVLPSIALASTNAARSGTAHALPPQQQEALDLAGVSVVRLVMTYKDSPVACTGLGTLIASGSPTLDNNSWVLTDSSLVHLSGTNCMGTAGQLPGITLFPNTTYINTSSMPQPLGQLQCSAAGCHDGITGSGPAEIVQPELETPGSAVIFSFHTDVHHLQPFLNVAQSSSNTSAPQFAIELANGSDSMDGWPGPIVVQTNDATDFLVPNLIITTTSGAEAGITPTPPPSPTIYEPGMPLIDANGTLIGMYLSDNKQLTLQQINDLMRTQLDLQPPLLAQAKSTNVLYKNWMTGVRDYYNHDYKDADKALKAIERTNPQFQAPLIFETFNVRPALQSSEWSATPTPATGNSGNATILGFPAQLIIMIGVVVGLIVLIVLPVVTSLAFRQARARRMGELARLKVGEVEAQRVAGMEAQRQARRPAVDTKAVKSNNESGIHLDRPLTVSVPMASPSLLAQAQAASPLRASIVEPTVDAFVQRESGAAATKDLQSLAGQLCPRCGQEVRAGALFCPRCRYQLVPSVPSATSDTPAVVSSEAGNEQPASAKAPQPVSASPAKEDVQVAQAILLRLWERADRDH